MTATVYIAARVGGPLHLRVWAWDETEPYQSSTTGRTVPLCGADRGAALRDYSNGWHNVLPGDPAWHAALRRTSGPICRHCQKRQSQLARDWARAVHSAELVDPDDPSLDPS